MESNIPFNFSGRSLGDCSTKDLKSLIDTLQIDIKNLQTSTLEEAKTASASTLKYNEEFFETDEGTSEEHNDAETPSPTDGAQVNLRNLPNPATLAVQLKPA